MPLVGIHNGHWTPSHCAHPRGHPHNPSHTSFSWNSILLYLFLAAHYRRVSVHLCFWSSLSQIIIWMDVLRFWKINGFSLCCNSATWPIKFGVSVHAKLLQLCSTLCDPMDCSLPGSSVHGILQARILEWIAMLSSRGSSQPTDQTWVSYISCIGRQVL